MVLLPATLLTPARRNKQARTIADLEAVSQNLMHADLRITDKVYGVLTRNDVHGLITGLADVDSENRQSVTGILELILAKVTQGEGI